jgi:ketosteroid isomerase-like protein
MRAELESLLRAHVEAENAHRMQDTLATLHEECVFEDTATGQIFRGRRGAEAHYRQWWDAFGLVFSREKEDRGYWTEDGSYIGQGRFHGVHIGPFLGIAATGKPVNFRFAVFVTFRDRLMSGEKFYYDLAGLLSQIDAVQFPWMTTNS